MCESRGCNIQNLDEWFTAFARWTLDVAFLKDKEEDQEALLQQRTEFCTAAQVSLRSWSPQTLKTVTNALAHLYRFTSHPVGIVPASNKQFPQYNLAFNQALHKQREKRDVVDPVQVLQDSELVALYDDTNFSSLYENQRLNLVILTYHLGQRPNNLINLKGEHQSSPGW